MARAEGIRVIVPSTPPIYVTMSTGGYSGFSGWSGYSGFSGDNPGSSGYSGFSGYSGEQGSGLSGYSGWSGTGPSGYSGFSGYSGTAASINIKWRDPVEARLSTPPVLPSVGERFIVVAPATGAWTGRENDIATWNGSIWTFETPEQDWTTLVQNEGVIYNFNGTSWVDIGSPTSGYSGFSGYSGHYGQDGQSGYSGFSGAEGPEGYSGATGESGYSGYSGAGGSGYSGYSGSGISGFSGYSGVYSTVLNVHQVAHGFSVGHVIRISGTNTYALAQANNGDNAEAVGVVTDVAGLDDFTYMEFGIWTSASVPNYAGGSPIFLSDTVAGQMTNIEPSLEGRVSKPLGVMLQAQVAMLILITRGAYIGRGFGGKFTTQPKTDDYAVTREDVGITFTMDALVSKTFFLPYVDGTNLGIWYTFVKLGAGPVVIQAYGTDVIAGSTPGGNVSNSQAGELFSIITLQFVAVGKWVITASEGTWVLA